MASVNKTVQLSQWDMIFSGKHPWCGEILLLITYPTFRQMPLTYSAQWTRYSLNISLKVFYEKKKWWGLLSISQVTSTIAIAPAAFLIFKFPPPQQSQIFLCPYTLPSACQLSKPQLFSNPIRTLHVLTGRHTCYMGWLASLLPPSSVEGTWPLNTASLFYTVTYSQKPYRSLTILRPSPLWKLWWKLTKRFKNC